MNKKNKSKLSYVKTVVDMYRDLALVQGAVPAWDSGDAVVVSIPS